MKSSSAFAEGPGPAAVYFGYRCAAWLAERLPLGAGDRVAHFFADVAYRTALDRRALVRRNLARVVGERANLDDLVKASFRSYADYWLETFRLGRYTGQDVERLVKFENASIENMDAAFAEGKGVLLITAHLGSYDLGVAWIGHRGWRFTTVAEVLRPRALFEWFAGIRTKWGWKVVPAERGVLAKNTSKILSCGEGIALVADRDLRRQGIWVDFFGERTTLPASPAMLLIRENIPLIAGAMYKQEEGFRVVFERVPYELSGNEERDLSSVAQVIAAALENLIKQAPEQWHLFTTNWPSDEPNLPPRGREAPAPQ